MDIKKIEKILAMVSGETSEANKQSAIEMIQDSIKEANDHWAAKVAEKDETLAKSQGEIDELKAGAEASSKELETISTELNQIKQQMEAAQKEQAYQNRMNELSEIFELSEAELEMVSKKAKSLEDEAYTEWFEEFSVFAEAKKKEVIEAKKAEALEAEEKIKSLESQSREESSDSEEVQVSEASAPEVEEEAAEEVLDNVGEEGGQSIANVQSPTEEEPSLTEKFQKAFGDTIKVEN